MMQSRVVLRALHGPGWALLAFPPCLSLLPGRSDVTPIGSPFFNDVSSPPHQTACSIYGVSTEHGRAGGLILLDSHIAERLRVRRNVRSRSFAVR